MHLFVLGANGLLGSNVVDTASDRGWEVVATHHSEEPAFDLPTRELDIRDDSRFGDLLDEFDPAAVVNCAALTDVDECQRKPDLAEEINGTAPGRLASECAARGTDFCHVSTDYVFDGTDSGLYSESATPAPIQMYGRSKLAGDTAVQDAHPEPLIVRPSFIYGVHRSDQSLTGFPAWVRNQLRSGDCISLFDDQHITPSRAGQIADTLIRLLSVSLDGIFNVACQTCTTPYDIGVVLRERLCYESVPIEAVSMKEIDRPANRPQHTCLDVSKAEVNLDITQPTLEDDLDTIEI